MICSRRPRLRRSASRLVACPGGASTPLPSVRCRPSWERPGTFCHQIRSRFSTKPRPRRSPVVEMIGLWRVVASSPAGPQGVKRGRGRIGFEQDQLCAGFERSAPLPLSRSPLDRGRFRPFPPEAPSSTRPTQNSPFGKKARRAGQMAERRLCESLRPSCSARAASGHASRPRDAERDAAFSFDHLVGAGEERGGIVRPSAFAVLRLMAISNLLGCITGSSAGFSPLSIRPA